MSCCYASKIDVTAGNGDDGLDLLVCRSCVVAGNRAAENGGDGIETDDLAEARVVNNRATGNGDDGLGLDGEEAEGNLGSRHRTGPGFTLSGTHRKRWHRQMPLMRHVSV